MPLDTHSLLGQACSPVFCCQLLDWQYMDSEKSDVCRSACNTNVYRVVVLVLAVKRGCCVNKTDWREQWVVRLTGPRPSRWVEPVILVHVRAWYLIVMGKSIRIDSHCRLVMRNFDSTLL